MKKEKTWLLFLLLAFGIPLVCSISMHYIWFLKEGAANLVLYGVEAASPSLAAVCTVYICSGKSKILYFLKEKYKKGFSIRYCLYGLLIPMAVLTLAKGVSSLILPGQSFLHMLTTKKLLIISWALIAEELGFRGYLQDWLEEKAGRMLTPILIGVIWSLWHYHYFLFEPMEVPVLIFAWGCIVDSFGYYVITKRSQGNVIPATIWHFSYNLFFNLYHLNPNWNDGSTLPYILTNLISSVYVIFFFWEKKRIPFYGDK